MRLPGATTATLPPASSADSAITRSTTRSASSTPCEGTPAASTAFTTRAVGVIELPQRVPFGFHGNWVSDTSVAPS